VVLLASLDWLYRSLACVLVAGGLAWMLWSVFGDRSRGRKRCPKCWYSMEGAPGLMCPECGRKARSERALFRTRRHRWRATLSLPLLAAALFAACWPTIKSGGWISPIPTRVLLEFYPWTGPNTKLGDELQLRCALIGKPGKPLSTPTDEQLAFAISRAARGNWLARPLSARWQDSYGQLLNSFRNAFFKSMDDKVYMFTVRQPVGESLVPALKAWAELPADFKVRTRPKWPRNMPISVYADVETWWPSWMMDMEKITWTASDEKTKGTQRFRGYTTLNVGLSGHVVIEGTVTVMQEEMKEGLQAIDQALPERTSKPFRIEYDTVDSIDDAMQAVGSPELNATLASSLTAVLDQYSMIKFSVSRPIPPGYDDVVFAATLEVMAGDRVLMTAHIRGLGFNKLFSGLYTYGDVSFAKGDDVVRLQRGEVDQSWKVRVRTDPQWALSELDAEKFWKGEFEVPIVAGKGK